MRQHRNLGRGRQRDRHDPIEAADADASVLFGRSMERRAARKAAQLCRQVQRALLMALAGDCADEALQDLYVQAVLPAPDASRLRVEVACGPTAALVPPYELLRRLEQMRGVLRAAVAEAIVRKRVPELAFVVVGPQEVSP